jgi:hypothetical protein
MTRAATLFPRTFTNVETLFDIFSESFRPLRIDYFKQIFSQIRLPPTQQAALLANTAINFTPSRPLIDIFNFGQPDLIKSFLQSAANSTDAAENCKYSFLIEHLIANFFERKIVEMNQELVSAVRVGVKTRQMHAVSDGRRRSKGLVGEELRAQDELKWSGDRILAHLELAQGENGTHTYPFDA